MRRILFLLCTLAANKKTPRIWMVPVSCCESREIISDQDADRPRWAPDGNMSGWISGWISGWEGELWFKRESGLRLEPVLAMSAAPRIGGRHAPANGVQHCLPPLQGSLERISIGGIENFDRKTPQ
jgi:hypothetical protein